jgi:hypothetical protein
MATLVEVIQAATGQTLQEVLAERIFEPLGMDHSSAHMGAEIGSPAFRAFTDERGVYEESTTWDPTWGLNGGMNASVADLGRWLRALNDGELLNDEDAELSLSPVTAGLGPMTEDRYFAFGSLVSGDWILGNPSLNGYQGFTAQHRDPSVTVVVWATAAPGNPGESNASVTVGQRIADIVSDDPIVLPGSWPASRPGPLGRGSGRLGAGRQGHAPGAPAAARGRRSTTAPTATSTRPTPATIIGIQRSSQSSWCTWSRVSAATSLTDSVVWR